MFLVFYLILQKKNVISGISVNVVQKISREEERKKYIPRHSFELKRIFWQYQHLEKWKLNEISYLGNKIGKLILKIIFDSFSKMKIEEELPTFPSTYQRDYKWIENVTPSKQ